MFLFLAKFDIGRSTDLNNPDFSKLLTNDTSDSRVVEMPCRLITPVVLPSEVYTNSIILIALVLFEIMPSRKGVTSGYAKIVLIRPNFEFIETILETVGPAFEKEVGLSPPVLEIRLFSLYREVSHDGKKKTRKADCIKSINIKATISLRRLYSSFIFSFKLSVSKLNMIILR